MKKLYPLKFKPQWMPKAWGGESWDICGFDDAASVVAEGFLADNDLPDILETYLGDLVGDAVFDWYGLYFPLLIKRLYVDERLSVQVHPDDTVAAERLDAYGKTEFWYVNEADPGARIWMGFREDTDAGTLYKACKEGTAERLLNEYIPRPGDCFFIPPGTVHAAGGGVRITEIQEASDTTFRLYDWGRELNPATRREMHLEEAIDCIDYRRYDEASNHHYRPEGVQVLARCPQFVITNLVLDDPSRPAKVRMEEFKSCLVYNCIAGSVTVAVGGQVGSSRAGTAAEGNGQSGAAAEGNGRYTLTAGEALLVPASCDDLLLTPAPGGCLLLQTHIPEPPKDDDVYDGPEPEA